MRDEETVERVAEVFEKNLNIKRDFDMGLPEHIKYEKERVTENPDAKKVLDNLENVPIIEEIQRAIGRTKSELLELLELLGKAAVCGRSSFRARARRWRCSSRFRRRGDWSKEKAAAAAAAAAGARRREEERRKAAAEEPQQQAPPPVEEGQEERRSSGARRRRRRNKH